MILLVALVPVGVTVFAIVDGAGRPEWAWQRAGQSKAVWIALEAVGIFVCFLGLIMSISISPPSARSWCWPSRAEPSDLLSPRRYAS